MNTDQAAASLFHFLTSRILFARTRIRQSLITQSLVTPCLITASMIALGLSHAAIAAELPATIDVVTDSEQISDGPYATIDGQNVVSQPLGDIDGDGLGDRLLEIPPTGDDLCPGVAILPSSMSTRLAFTRDELDSLVRIVDTPFTASNDTTACRFRNFRVFTEPRRMGDINGDGLIDLLINVSGIFDNTPRIIFGSTTPGTRIDPNSLDGSNGFRVVGRGYVVFPVGDVNNDGIDDIGHWQGSAAAQGIIAGQSSYAAQLDVSAVAANQRLISPLAISGLRGLGDIDGDGFADLLAYPRELQPASENNVPRLIYGAPGLDLQSLDQPGARVTRLLDECGLRFCSIYPVGDLDADGRDDIIASQRFETNNQPPRIIIYGREGGIEPRNALNDYSDGERTRLVDEANGWIQDRGRVYAGGFNDPYLIATGQRIDFDGDGADDLLLKQRVSESRQGWCLLFGTPGSRPAVRSFAEADGLLGVAFDLGTAISPITSIAPPSIGDLNSDGLFDFVWTSRAGTPFVAGQSRDLDGVDAQGLLVRRGPESSLLDWQTVPEAIAYRVQVNGLFVTDVPAGTTALDVADFDDGAAARYTVQAYDAGGMILLTQPRQVPAYRSPVSELSVAVYGERLLELFFSGERNAAGRSLNTGPFLVLRDGLPIGRAQGNTYVDDTVEPGRTYAYQIMPDALSGAAISAPALSASVRVQRISQRVEATTPGTPAGPVSGDAGKGSPEAPENLRVQRYSLKDAEVFWDRAAEPLLQYEVFRNGQQLKTQFGISYFDTTLPPGAGARYEIVALRPDGARSSAVAVTLPPAGVVTNGPPSPAQLRSLIYSATAAELFWTRADVAQRIVSTEVSRDGQLIGTSPGNSFFDNTREPGRAHQYSLVAINASGERSEPATISTSTNGR